MADLGDVRWIGGGSGAGKSTVARLIGAAAGLPVVHTDASIPAHAALLAEAPRMHRFLAQDLDERWLGADPAAMLDAFPWFAGEGFDLLLEEVAALPPGPVVVEGFRLLPRLVAPLLADPTRAVWLLPTPAFRAAAFARRSGDEAFWERTSDPARALANLRERDRLFTERVRAEAGALELRTVEVDGTIPAKAVAAAVADGFGLGGAGRA